MSNGLNVEPFPPFAMGHGLPSQVGWLTTKVLPLVVYIGLSMVAITRGKTQSVRIAAWLAAPAVYACIFLIALTKNSNLFGG